MGLLAGGGVPWALTPALITLQCALRATVQELQWLFDLSRVSTEPRVWLVWQRRQPHSGTVRTWLVAWASWLSLFLCPDALSSLCDCLLLLTAICQPSTFPVCFLLLSPSLSVSPWLSLISLL